MPHAVDQVRNLALIGHSGAGKTSLGEAILFCTGKINRMGRIEEGNTVADYDQEEIERKMSLRTSLLNGEWDGHHIHLMDTPGYPDFITEAKAAQRVADAAVAVVDSQDGVEVGTERVWAFGAEYGVPRFVFINKLDREELDLDTVLAQVQDRFGRQAVPLQLPVNPGPGFNQVIDLIGLKALTYADGKAQEGEIPAELADTAQTLHEQLVESVAETDEELMEKYFSEGELTPDELRQGIGKAVLAQELFPVLYGDALNAVGVAGLLDAIVSYAPSPAASPGIRFEAEGDEVQLDAAPHAPLAAFVFKTVAEQHVGELSFLRIYAGTLKAGDEVVNVSRRNNERIGQFFYLNGHERAEVDTAGPGDLVALVKLKDTHTGNTLAAKGQTVVLPEVEYPEPLIRVAVSPKEKGQEDRMASGLAQMHEEDPSFVFKYDPDIRQSLLMAQGELHLETLLNRLKERFKVEIDQETPRIPYLETISANADAHYRHKKQTGGRGQFGEVYIRMAPKGRGEGFEFLNQVVGGNIPSNFIPAVEKGIVETLPQGPLSGSKVVDLEVAVYDGKHHPVDSDEVSFKLASSHAFRDAFLKAKPVLLEPIYHVTIKVPEEFMGDVMGDLSSRRGRIQGMDADGHFQVIRAEVPLAELDRYATTLRSMTQGKGMHTQSFDRYEDVPRDIMTKILEANTREAA